MKLFLTIIVLISVIILPFSYGAKILGVFHVPTRSHYTLGLTLMKELASRGHEVTLVSAFNESHPNLENIYLDNMHDVMKRRLAELTKHSNGNLWYKIKNSNNLGVEITKAALNNDNMQELLGRNENYDLVILEYLRSEALLGIAAHFKAPLVLVSTYCNIMVNTFTGNIAPYSFVPDNLVNFNDKMTFLERFQNGIVRFLNDFMYRFQALPSQAFIYNSYFKSDGNFFDVMSNVSLVLMNTHATLETPKPSMPNMIPVGGFHIKKPKKLPQDLQNFLDDAKHGAIFFSFGSNLKASSLPLDKINIFIEAFRSLKHLKVLWKYENENLEVSSNVLIKKWFPQNEVLAHPNIKIFISHGGMLSLTEAIYRGVPVISFPFYGDQLSNSLALERNNIGIKMEFKNFNQEDLIGAMKAVLSNRYQEKVNKMSSIIKDQPDHPLDRAMFWIEHILRHGGGNHLKSPAVDLNWYQYTSVDIFAIYLFIIFFALLVIISILTIILILLYKSYYYLVRTVQRFQAYQQTLNEKKYH